MWGFIVTLGLLWIVKVPLINWGLRQVPGDFEVSITGLRPGFAGAEIKGLKVIHRPTGRLVGYAASITPANGWSRLVRGDFGKLAIDGAEVNWRPEFETMVEAPIMLGPAASPLLTWEEGEAADCVFSWYERGHEVPRLSFKITSVKGGRFIIYNDGRMEAAEQRAVLEDIVSREFTADNSLEIESRSPRAEGIATARREGHRFTAETLRISAPAVNLVWRRGEPLPMAPPDVPGPPRPAWDPPAEFFIKEGTSEPGKVILTIRSPGTGPVEFTSTLSDVRTTGLCAGGGHRCRIEMGTGVFGNLESAGAATRLDSFAFTASLDEARMVHVSSAAVDGMVVTDSARLLASLGCTPEQLKLLPAGGARLEARGTNLLAGARGITSPDVQRVVLQEVSAALPGKKEISGKSPRVALSAVPDEVLREGRLRSVEVEKPELTIDYSGLPLLSLVQKAASPEIPPASSAGGDWGGWRADSLVLEDGRVKITGLGFGIPDVTAAFAIGTRSNDGGDPFYRIRASDLTLENTLLPSVKSKAVMEVDVDPREFWKTGKPGQIVIDGEKVGIDGIFQKLFKPADAVKPATPGPAAEGTPDAPE